MKKITLLTIMILIASTTFAQKLTEDTEPRLKGIGEDITTLGTQKLRRAVGGHSGWFNYINVADAIVADPANLNTFIRFISFDSSLVQVSTTSTFHVGAHAIGTMCDPTDPDWKEMLDPIVPFNEHSKYTFDSLQFRYIYLRTVDSMMVSGKNEKVIDTLFVQYFLRPQMRYYAFGSPNGELALVPDSLNATSGLANNYAKIDTVLLDESDSTLKSPTGYFLKNMRIPVGLSNNLPDGKTPAYTGTTWNGLHSYGNCVVGFNMFFKSMKPVVMGDTMDAPDGIVIHNKHNAFGYQYAIDQNPRDAQLLNSGHLNGSFLNLKSLRYGQTNSNGWKHYIPGRAFFERQYQNAFFKLTTKHNVSAKDINANGYGVAQVYPNPTNGMANIEVSLKKSNNVKVQIMNISGQIVISKTEYVSNGVNTLSFNTENLAKGIYLATVTVDGNSFARKFIVE